VAAVTTTTGGTGQQSARQTCGQHGAPAEELRTLVLAAIDRIGPVLDRMRTEPADAAPTASTCAVCPVCAVIAALRGERPELAARLAEQAAGLLTVLRAALEESGPAPAAPPTADGGSGTRRVQHIRVDRPAR
jgi:hypothetical protein